MPLVVATTRGASTNHDWKTMRTCDLEGCSNKHNAKGLCNAHYFRLRRSGSFELLGRPDQRGEKNPNWVGESASYLAVHSRIRAAQGPASLRTCVDCEGPACDWAYTYTSRNEIPSPMGPYTTDITHYQPMCRPCHKKFDYNTGLVPV